jgi:hypothetical protein
MTKLGGILSPAAVVACDPGKLPPREPTSAPGLPCDPVAVTEPRGLSHHEGLTTLVPVDDCVAGLRSYQPRNGVVSRRLAG